MMRIPLCAVCVLLAACSTTTPSVRVVKVPPPPTIEMPAKPTLPADATQDQKVRAIADYVLVMRARLEEALLALEVYK